MHNARRKNPRRTPIQARALDTCEVIYQAAIQILETRGERAFTTNNVAERAGVSVGTLYQYFPDKQAILIGLARREMSSIETWPRKTAIETRPWNDAIRHELHRYIHTLAGKPATRRAALKAILATATPEELAASSRLTTGGLPNIPHATALDAYVLTRAVTGVVRAAVLENDPRLLTPAFEAALMRLVDGYARQLTKDRRKI